MKIDFDYTSLAQVMREMLIFLMNEETGVDENGTPNPTDDEGVFWRAQQKIMTLREKAQKAYRSATQQAQIQKKEFGTPVWAFGMAQYQALVEQGKSFRDVSRVSSSKLSRLADEVYADLASESNE